MEKDNSLQPTLPDLVGSILRSMGSSIPILSSMAQAWSEYNNIIQTGNIQMFLNYLKIEIESHGEKLAENICSSKESIYLLQLSLNSIKDELNEIKIKLHSKVLINCLIEAKEHSLNTKKDVIEQLNLLNEEDIKILEIFGSAKVIQIASIGIVEDEEVIDNDEIRMGKLLVSINKFTSRGILVETNPNKPVTIYDMPTESPLAKYLERKIFWIITIWIFFLQISIK